MEQNRSGDVRAVSGRCSRVVSGRCSGSVRAVFGQCPGGVRSMSGRCPGSVRVGGGEERVLNSVRLRGGIVRVKESVLNSLPPISPRRLRGSGSGGPQNHKKTKRPSVGRFWTGLGLVWVRGARAHRRAPCARARPCEAAPARAPHKTNNTTTTTPPVPQRRRPHPRPLCRCCRALPCGCGCARAGAESLEPRVVRPARGRPHPPRHCTHPHTGHVGAACASSTMAGTDR